MNHVGFGKDGAPASHIGGFFTFEAQANEVI
jgi:hypothetical protein